MLKVINRNKEDHLDLKKANELLVENNVAEEEVQRLNEDPKHVAQTLRKVNGLCGTTQSCFRCDEKMLSVDKGQCGPGISPFWP